MKTLISLITVFLFILVTNHAEGQIDSKGIKIGTYDSRIVTLAYSRSDLFMERSVIMRKEGNEIMNSGDTAKKIETIYKIFTEQFLLHQQVFCTGSSAYLLDLIKDKLPQLAKESGVCVIVSKWELPYTEPGVQIIDLTMPIAQLFKPKEDIGKLAGEISNQPPIPMEEFTVEEVVDMWKQFEIKYLGKK